jgi:hypothetical protein
MAIRIEDVAGMDFSDVIAPNGPSTDRGERSFHSWTSGLPN